MDKKLHTPALETQIRDQISEIDQKIEGLVAEREALQRVLVRVHNQGMGHTKSVRSNGYNRLLIENRVLEELTAAEDGRLSTRQLLVAAHATVSRMKDVTFRSYLHRMKEKGLIAPVERMHGHWQLPPKPASGLIASAEKPLPFA